MAKTEPMHTITLFKNDGSSSYIYMDTDVLPSITSLTNWSREGYDFVEWNSKADGSGISYAPGYTIVTLDENELNFYTIWKCSVISKVKLPDGSLKYISTDWENITNKPTGLTREEIIEIISELYPEATSQELNDMADEILENYPNVTEDMIETILSEDSNVIQYAPINSPTFEGIPTAPTAPFGTNTTQIATTAFVQQAIRPTIMVTISDMPTSASVAVTATLIGSDPEYSVTETVSAAGIASLGLDYLGEYSITFNNPQVKGNPTINVTIPKVYTYGAYWSELITYTVLIDKTNSNTATACTYADDALGMTKGSSAWDNMPIFKQIRPCVFQSGQVNYYLNPNNWNEKYGTNEASILTGEDGDVMIQFPKFAYKIKTEDNIITVSVSTDPSVIENDSDYTYDAFSRLEEGDLNFFYKGAFKGSLDGDGKLRSIVGTKPANNKTIGAFRTAAQANGAHYQQSTYAQLKALQCLYLIKYGDRNGQTAVGKGVVNASASYVSGYNTVNVADISAATNTLTSGMTFGTTANGTTHMRLFGIEDFWGCIWEWVDGLTTDSSRNIITSWNSFSNEGIAATTISTASGLTANANGWNKNVAGNTAAGFMPIEFGGSSSTYWAGNGALYASCVLRFGGRWTAGDQAGPFILHASLAASFASADFGARLSYA